MARGEPWPFPDREIEVELELEAELEQVRQENERLKTEVKNLRMVREIGVDVYACLTDRFPSVPDWMLKAFGDALEGKHPKQIEKGEGE